MKLHTKITTAVAAVAFALAGTAFAQDEAKSDDQKSMKASKHDEAWAHMTAVSDACEIKLAKAAQEKASSEQVKQHAAKMIQDHQKTTDELKQIAKSAKIDLDAKIPSEKQAMIKEITSKSGEEFDKAYMEHEVAAHRMAAAHFQNGADFNKHPELQSFAQKNLPVIKQHLAEVEKGGHGQHATGTQTSPSRTPATAGSRPAATDTTTTPGAGQRSPATQSPRGTQPQPGNVRTE
ncbi:MAG: DUF4142 domain-containing protein [Chthoniobacteraceae bacterium]